MKIAFKNALMALLCAGSALLAPSAQAASLWNDPSYIQRQAELAIAKAAGKALQQAVIAARDSEALTSASCTDLDTARRNAALEFYERGQPPDPSKIIQNTTCFIDVAAIKIPVSLTGIGFLDGLISDFGQKMMNGACGKLGSYINDLKNSAMSQISGAVSGATGGALNLGQLSAGVITVNVGGQNIKLIEGVDPTQQLMNAGNTLANQAIQQATNAIAQSTYDSINGTLGQNSGSGVSQANAAVAQATADYKAAQCQYNGVGANETCPCPTANSLLNGTQNIYPQCTDTYDPWWSNSGGNGP